MKDYTVSDTQACPQDRLDEVVATVQRDEIEGVSALDALISDYGQDPRLHFLKGSLLAGLKRYSEAQTSMQAAVAIAPDYGVARFQLGLLQLSSGDADSAFATWRPILDMPAAEPLVCFVRGLEHMAANRFPEAIEKLREGIAGNQTVLPINRDMQMLIDEMLAQEPTDIQAEVEPSSATHFLLQQFRAKPTQH